MTAYEGEDCCPTPTPAVDLKTGDRYCQACDADLPPVAPGDARASRAEIVAVAEVTP